MRAESYDFFKSMLETPSVSGFEEPVARIVRKRMKKYASSIETDVHGNTIVALNPKGKPRVLLAGHCDQIGLMIQHINDEGFLHFASVGGIDPTVLPGSRVTVHAKKGPVEGVIGRKPIHLMKQEERGQGKVELTDLWIDIGAKDKATAAKQVSVADPVTYKLGAQKLGDHLITSPALDNKVGCYVVMEALRLASTKKLNCSLYAVATVQEEIGLRGARTSAYGVDPQVGIAVDVTHATDNPGADKRAVGDVRLGAGAVIERGANINTALCDAFLATAKKKKIAHQLSAAPNATPTDANAIQISKAGVAAALISVPNRYMHTQVEVCHLDDLDACAKLIAETVATFNSRTSFIPK